jgi:peptide/nickel transport system substrate-binding protein
MPQYGGVFRRGDPPLKVLSFLDNVPMETLTIVTPVYNKLVDWQFEGATYQFRKVEGSPAKSWEVSQDGRAWTFRLREGVKFHDGSPFTSADVKATYDHYLNPGQAGPPARSYISPFVASVEAPDPQTVVLKLKALTPVLLDNLAVGWVMIAPKKYLDQGIDWFQTNAIGTGPFKWNVAKWERGISFQVDRNPDYWDAGLPYLDTIVTLAMTDAAVRVAAFETKKIDQVKQLTRGQNQDIVRRYGDALHAIDLAGDEFQFFMYNTRKPPFDNAKVRQALFLWIDRLQFREKSQQGGGFIGSWIEPNTFPGFGTTYEELSKTQLAYQPDKTAARKRAKELLAEAGYADLNRFKIRVTPFRNFGTYLPSGEIAAAQLREMGFDAALEPMEALALTQALGAGNFDLVTYAGGIAYSAPDAILGRYVASKGQRNYSGLTDENLDRLIAQVNTLDAEKRKRAMAELEQYLLTGQNATHLLFFIQRTVLEWNYLRGHRYIEGNYEERNTRTWLASDAPGRK